MEITKGNKYRKTIKFDLDPNCDGCMKTLEEIKKFYYETLREVKKYGDFYGQHFEKTIPAIIIRPDFNASDEKNGFFGCITHWHICHEDFSKITDEDKYQKQTDLKTNLKEIEKARKKESQSEDCMLPVRDRC